MIPLYAYCLFCETQRCKIIAEYIHRNYGYQCLLPQIIQRKWIKGLSTEKSYEWLPGYLFLYTDKKIIPKFDISGIIRCLGNEELNGNDLKFAQMIKQKNGIMGTVPIVQEGDKCTISDSAWKDFSGKVIKMDHERKRCCIEFAFDGIIHKIWVGYEFADHLQK